MVDEKQTVDETQASGGEPTPRSESTYIVQVEQQIEQVTFQDDPDLIATSVWVDIATVTVPARSPRKRVIGEALAQSGLRPQAGQKPLRMRVLDAASFHTTEVAPYQPEPEWRVA
jgi:hypothetical protein